MNTIFLIKPYRWNNLWVFDDENVGLQREPFVAGIDKMIDEAIKIKDLDPNTFVMIFSGEYFPDHDFHLNWVCKEGGGNVYEGIIRDGEIMDGWLCPALYKYFEEAPKNLYVQLRKTLE